MPKVISKNLYGQSYENVRKNDKVCYIPASKKDKIEALKGFIFSRMEKRWEALPKQAAALEKVYVTELLKSL